VPRLVHSLVRRLPGTRDPLAQKGDRIDCFVDCIGWLQSRGGGQQVWRTWPRPHRSKNSRPIVLPRTSRPPRVFGGIPASVQDRLRSVDLRPIVEMPRSSAAPARAVVLRQCSVAHAEAAVVIRHEAVECDSTKTFRPAPEKPQTEETPGQPQPERTG